MFQELSRTLNWCNFENTIPVSLYVMLHSLDCNIWRCIFALTLARSHSPAPDATKPLLRPVLWKATSVVTSPTNNTSASFHPIQTSNSFNKIVTQLKLCFHVSDIESWIIQYSHLIYRDQSLEVWKWLCYSPNYLAGQKYPTLIGKTLRKVHHRQFTQLSILIHQLISWHIGENHLLSPRRHHFIANVDFAWLIVSVLHTVHQ